MARSLVGLEFDGTMLRGRGHTSVVISHTSIIVPFALGAVLARYLYPRLSPPTVPFSSFTLFMGAAMSITAFPVLARILVERRLLHSKLGAVAITCAAVDDVTAWCILAFVVSIVRAGSLGDAARTTALALVYIGVMLALVRPFLRRLAGRSANKEGLSQNLVAMTLVLLLLSSLTTEVIGIHALFGAFMIGSIIPKANGFAYLSEAHIASIVWPASIVPMGSMVTEIIKGRSVSISRESRRIARIAALIFRVSWEVSIINRSAPPSTRGFAKS